MAHTSPRAKRPRAAAWTRRSATDRDGRAVAIRTRLTLLICLLIAAPLLFSAVFWINTPVSSLGGLRWEDLIYHGREEVEERAALRFWNTALAHNNSVVRALTPVGRRHTRELTFLTARLQEGKCLTAKGDLPAPCRALAREFLGLHPELEGLLAFSGTRFAEVLNREVPRERLSAIHAALIPLAQAAENVALRPVSVGPAFLLATAHGPRGAPGWSVIVWTAPRDFPGPFGGVVAG